MQFIQIIRRAIKRLGEERAVEAAAGMAYYGFFSLFPLILILIIGSSTFLEDPGDQQKVISQITKVFPVSPELLEDNINQVLRARNSAGIISSIGLLWSASGAFTTLVRNVTRAYKQANTLNSIKTRLFALIIVMILVVLLVGVLILGTVFNVFSGNPNSKIANVFSSVLTSDIGINILAGFVLFVILTLMYKALPAIRVYWKSAAAGGLVGAIGIQAITYGFSYWLESGFVDYNLVYGSLGALTALLFWIYLINLIIFFGAHLSASINLQAMHQYAD